jgi:hypothetical protein
LPAPGSTILDCAAEIRKRREIVNADLEQFDFKCSGRALYRPFAARDAVM